MEHVRHWERIALVTNVDWIGAAMKVFSFLMPGDVRPSHYPPPIRRVSGSPIPRRPLAN
jgi:hypothetical protein